MTTRNRSRRIEKAATKSTGRAYYLRGYRAGRTAAENERGGRSLHFMKPKTFAVTVKDGGHWLPHRHEGVTTVHSIMFDNGHIWDPVNGWRCSVANYRLREIEHAWREHGYTFTSIFPKHREPAKP